MRIKRRCAQKLNDLQRESVEKTKQCNFRVRRPVSAADCAKESKEKENDHSRTIKALFCFYDLLVMGRGGLRSELC